MTGAVTGASTPLIVGLIVLDMPKSFRAANPPQFDRATNSAAIASVFFKKMRRRTAATMPRIRTETGPESIGSMRVVVAGRFGTAIAPGACKRDCRAIAAKR